MKRSTLLSLTLLPTLFLQAEVCHWESPMTQNCTQDSNSPMTHNYNANNCEFYVEGFGEGTWSHNGNGAQWIEAYLNVDVDSLELDLRGKVLAAGIYTEGNYFLGVSNTPGKYRVGMSHYLSPNIENAKPLGDIAFFIDIKRENNTIERLWLSNAGENFKVARIFEGANSTTQSLGSGSIRWVGDNSALFNQARACRKE